MAFHDQLADILLSGCEFFHDLFQITLQEDVVGNRDYLSIEYMYSFANGDVAHVIIRPSDLESCERILAEKKVDLMAASDLYKL